MLPEFTNATQLGWHYKNGPLGNAAWYDGTITDV
jgi:hypothetical protein